MNNLSPYFSRSAATRPETNWLAEDFFRPFFWGMESFSDSFRVDVRDEGDKYLLEADLPGFKREQVHVDVDEGVLTIATEGCGREKGERAEGYLYSERRCERMRRSFTLNQIDEEAVKAEYSDGVLKITLPKKDGHTSGGRRIEIQ